MKGVVDIAKNIYTIYSTRYLVPRYVPTVLRYYRLLELSLRRRA